MTPLYLTDDFDCLLLRDSVPHCIPFNSGSDDPLVRSLSIRNAAAAVEKPTDRIAINRGAFDFGSKERFLVPSCRMYGLNLWSSILLGSVISDAVGCNFSLQNSHLSDLTLINRCYDMNEDGRCVGFDNDNFGVGIGPYTASLRRMRILCDDWGVYGWYALNHLLIEDSLIYSGRVCVAAENSGNGQTYQIIRSYLEADASYSKSVGATSDRYTGGAFGIIQRGGDMYVGDTRIKVVGQHSSGPSYTPRACCITSHGGGGDGPAGNTTLTLKDFHSRYDCNGADPNLCFDLDSPGISPVNIKFLGTNTGSGINGEFHIAP